MARHIAACILIAFLAMLAGAPAAQASDCGFVLGFATLHDLIPTIVGGCLGNEQHNPANGDGLQHTTNGLLVWRKADNFTAFTDGYRTWVNGPYGIEERLNSQRFPWEVSGPGGPFQLVEPNAKAAIVRYYAFINQRDYADAYAMLLNHPQTYAQFVAGYADTAHVDVAVGMPEGNNAAGHIGLDFPTVLLARHTNGALSGFAGCYTVETLNPGLLTPGTPPPPWQIAASSLHQLPGLTSLSDPAAQQVLASPCPGHASA